MDLGVAHHKSYLDYYEELHATSTVTSITGVALDSVSTPDIPGASFLWEGVGMNRNGKTVGLWIDSVGWQFYLNNFTDVVIDHGAQASPPTQLEVMVWGAANANASPLQQFSSGANTEFVWSQNSAFFMDRMSVPCAILNQTVTTGAAAWAWASGLDFSHVGDWHKVDIQRPYFSADMALNYMVKGVGFYNSGSASYNVGVRWRIKYKYIELDSMALQTLRYSDKYAVGFNGGRRAGGGAFTGHPAQDTPYNLFTA